MENCCEHAELLYILTKVLQSTMHKKALRLWWIVQTPMTEQKAKACNHIGREMTGKRNNPTGKVKIIDTLSSSCTTNARTRKFSQMLHTRTRTRQSNEHEQFGRTQFFVLAHKIGVDNFGNCTCEKKRNASTKSQSPRVLELLSHCPTYSFLPRLRYSSSTEHASILPWCAEDDAELFKRKR